MELTWPDFELHVQHLQERGKKGTQSRETLLPSGQMWHKDTRSFGWKKRCSAPGHKRRRTHVQTCIPSRRRFYRPRSLSIATLILATFLFPTLPTFPRCFAFCQPRISEVSSTGRRWLGSWANSALLIQIPYVS